MKYTRDEVFKSTLEYFKGDELATNVWINKYALKNSNGDLYELNPNDMHNRLAKEIHRIELKYPNPLSEAEIFDVLKDFKYIIPQGGPMSGIGNNKQVVSLSNCFVIGNDFDSYGSIMRVDEQQAQLMKRRGGVGHDLSHIRPKGSVVKNSALTSTGLVPFMERYSNSTREVGQDGRRGALMLSLDVRHPDVEDFIDAKLDSTKITGANISVKLSDDFMAAVVDGDKYTQKYPLIGEPRMTTDVDATPIFDKIVNNAWKSAEPGILFWDTVINESVSDCYPASGFRTVSTNPCIVGDTMVAVADGRGQKTIKELSDEGKDVPVYSYDDSNNIVIKTMRNPRLTNNRKKIFKVILDNGQEFKVTHDHSFRLKDGDYVEAQNLKKGDSLKSMTRYENKYKKSNTHFYIRGGNTYIAEDRMIASFYNDINLGDLVVHHKDYNSLNNSPDNLVIMSKKDHDYLNSKDMIGDKNPYHKMTYEWKHDFASHPGKSNGKYIEISNDALIEIGVSLTKKYGRRLSKEEWITYAKENNLPQYFSDFRDSEIGGVEDFLKICASILNIDNIEADPRVVKTYLKAVANGYNTKIVDNEVFVEKICETCSEKFFTLYHKREVSFCSIKCSLKYVNNDKKISEKRTTSLNKTYKNKAEETKLKQTKVLSDLKFNLGRTPKMKEWENSCKVNNIPCRLKTKYGFQNFKEVISEGEFYNHKVVSSEFYGYDKVYNGTVDDTHNYLIGTKGSNSYTCTKNCGEIPLPPYDSCRLLAINLYSYVNNPFTKEANFNLKLFKKHVVIAQRIMDDIVDLEIEKIEKILEKINNDPEPDEIKRVERLLWENMIDMAKKGRRTGIGITAEGDMLAAMGLTYGTDPATKFSVMVHKNLAIETYKASCVCGQERGSFGVYDPGKETLNPFLNRLANADPELRELLKGPRRNISLLTIAPTGSASLMTQTTSGIEPTFLPVYKRNRKINPNDKNVVVAFTDENGDSWEEYLVFHHHFRTWLEINGYNFDEVQHYSPTKLDELIKKSPYYKATSNDVDWVAKVKMQGAIQKWVDHSISVTVNLPNTATPTIVADVYKMAWKSGCKGITVYRDGSRTGVLVSNKETVNEILKENHAPKRPKKIKCDILRFQNNKEKWIGFTGLLDNEPYEIFTGLLEAFNVPNYVNIGWIEKTRIDGNSRYDFIYTDRDGYTVTMEGLSRAFNQEYWNYGKLISGVLRHGMPIPSVVNLIKTLKLGGDSFSTWQSGCIRMIKAYIKDGTIAQGETCPICGNELTFTDGCLSCITTEKHDGCGYSKCG